jgi:ribosomal protein L11 methyltransferase
LSTDSADYSHLTQKTIQQGVTIKRYTEIEVVVPQDIADPVSNFLVEIGSKGVWLKQAEENSHVVGYFSEEKESAAIKKSILLYLDELKRSGLKVGESKVFLRTIQEKAWAEDWKKSFEPIFVTKDIVVIPGWEKRKFPNRLVIRINPGMAFGTGDHATTRLCMRTLVKAVKYGDKVIDVGCGSGILGILSVMLGASYALGLDIDQDAISNAEENINLNHVEEKVEVRLGTANVGIPEAPFDVAVANINRIEIVESYDKIEPLVKAGGTLIFSGILDGEEGYMTDFFKRQELNVREATHQDEWICFVGRK